MKKFDIALAAGMAICIFASAFQLPFSRNCEDVRGDTLRLHIIANSDSDDDQAVKLAVRDALLENSEALLTGARDKDSAIQLIGAHTGDIEAVAQQVLQSNGFAYGARAYITEMYFEQRTYESFTLPAGYYTALRVELGEAAGHNWWCVVYPTLCVPAATEQALDDYSEEELEVILEGEKYVVKFKIEEWLQQLLEG